MANTSLTYLLVIRWSAPDKVFVAKAPGLPGCIGTGDTYQAALQSCLEAMQWRAEQAEQRGPSLPGKPSTALLFSPTREWWRVNWFGLLPI